MNQVARNIDPSTSWDAADRARVLAGLHGELVFSALLRYGPQGKDGIATILSLIHI